MKSGREYLTRRCWPGFTPGSVSGGTFRPPKMPAFRKMGRIRFFRRPQRSALHGGPFRLHLGIGSPQSRFRAMQRKEGPGIVSPDLKTDRFLMREGIRQARPQLHIFRVHRSPI